MPSFILPKMVQNLPSTARHTREHLSVGVPEGTAGSPSVKDTLAVTHAHALCENLYISSNVGIVHDEVLRVCGG